MKYVGVLNVHRLDAYGNGLLFRTHVLHVCVCVYVLRPRLWLNFGVSVPVQCFLFCYATAVATVPPGRERSPGAELSQCSSETPQDAERFARFLVCLFGAARQRKMASRYL